MATSTECQNGKYGPNCLQICGACTGNAPCDKKNGQCPAGCQGTLLPPLCKKGCPLGFYGANCDQKCGKCSYFPCDKTTGFCLCPSESGSSGIKDPYQATCNVCFKGYNPPLCLIKPLGSKSTPLARTSLWIILALFTTLILGIMCFIVIRKRQNSQRANLEANRRVGPRDATPYPLLPVSQLWTRSSGVPETEFQHGDPGTEYTEEDVTSEASSAYDSRQTL